VAAVALVAALAAACVVPLTLIDFETLARVLLVTPNPTWAKENVAVKRATDKSIDFLLVFID
jgi:hypothetical protein